MCAVSRVSSASRAAAAHARGRRRAPTRRPPLSTGTPPTRTAPRPQLPSPGPPRRSGGRRRRARAHARRRARRAPPPAARAARRPPTRRLRTHPPPGRPRLCLPPPGRCGRGARGGGRVLPARARTRPRATTGRRVASLPQLSASARAPGHASSRRPPGPARRLCKAPARRWTRPPAGRVCWRAQVPQTRRPAHGRRAAQPTATARTPRPAARQIGPAAPSFCGGET